MLALLFFALAGPLALGALVAGLILGAYFAHPRAYALGLTHGCKAAHKGLMALIRDDDGDVRIVAEGDADSLYDGAYLATLQRARAERAPHIVTRSIDRALAAAQAQAARKAPAAD